MVERTTPSDKQANLTTDVIKVASSNYTSGRTGHTEEMLDQVVPLDTLDDSLN